MRSAACVIALALLGALPAAAQRASAVFIAAPSSQIVAGDTIQLNATAWDSSGNSIPSAKFTWSVADSSVLTVDPNGALHAITLGFTDVRADTTGAGGTLRVQVVPLKIDMHPQGMTVHAGENVHYSADVIDVNGQPLSGVPLQWRAFGANSNTNNGIGMDASGVAYTSGYGTYFIEAYFNYPIGTGPFLQRAIGNALLQVLPPNAFTHRRLLDGDSARQNYQLRERKGQISVNDAGQIAYTGSMEGFANAALVWSGGAFRAMAAAGTPAELPGSSLMDIDDPALNGKGEIATRCVLAPYRNCLLFSGTDAVPHMILFDGGTGGGATNIRNFATTRFGLTDGSAVLFRADYVDIGSTVFKTGLFTISQRGSINLVVAAATPLPGLGSTYTFDRDFGIANDGSILFFATNSPSRALYRMSSDYTITRVVGTGDAISGSPILSLGSVAVGRNGDYAVNIYNGVSNNLLLFNGDPSTRRQLPLTGFNGVFAVSNSGEAVFVGGVPQGYGLCRWDGSRVRLAAALGAISPTGEAWTQFDSAGITGRGELIAQARTANNLLIVVNLGSSAADKTAIVFKTGAPVIAQAGTAFNSFVLNSHSGNPMIKTGSYTNQILEVLPDAVLPRLVNGDRTPGGSFFEGLYDVRRNGDGDLFILADQSLSFAGSNSTSLLARFPQRVNGGTFYNAYQIAANTSGTVAIAQGTSLGVNALSLVSNGALNPIAWLGNYQGRNTPAPGGGLFLSANDIGVADDGTVYASIRLDSGVNGLFAWSAGKWNSLLRVGDVYDKRAVTSLGAMRIAGNDCFVMIFSGSFWHLAVYDQGAWRDILGYGDAIPAGGVANYVFSFDPNRNGAVAVMVAGTGGAQYVLHINGSTLNVAANNTYPLSTGETVVNYFQVSLNDDNRIFATGMNAQDHLVLYEFDPLF